MNNLTFEVWRLFYLTGCYPVSNDNQNIINAYLGPIVMTNKNDFDLTIWLIECELVKTREIANQLMKGFAS